MSRYQIPLVFMSVFGVALLCFVSYYRNSSYAEEKTGAADAIKEMKKQRIDLLVKINLISLAQYQAGTCRFEEVYETKAALLKGRIELAETKQDLIKVCEEAIKDAKEFEKITENRFKGGLATEGDHLKAKVYELDTRIALEKAKAVK